MKFTNAFGTKIITTVQGIPKKIAKWSLKTKIIVTVSSLVVTAGAVTGGVVLYQQLNKPQPVIAVEEDSETEEVIEVAQNTEEKRMDISIPSFLACNVVGESVEKDLTLYVKGADDNKIAGVPFQIKLVKPEDATALQESLDVISDVNSKIAALAAGESVDVTGTINEVVSTEEDTENKGTSEEKDSIEKKDAEEKNSEEKVSENNDSASKNSEKSLEEAEKEAIAALTPNDQLLVAKRKAIESYNTVLTSVSGNAYTDEDADGMIYIESIDPGDYIACYVPTSDYDATSYTTQVNVKEKIEYKKVANIKEKKEEYTPAVDVAPPVIKVESVMKNTVEYVESRTEKQYIATKAPSLSASAGNRKSETKEISTNGSATDTQNPGVQTASMEVETTATVYAGNSALNQVGVNVNSVNISSIKAESDNPAVATVSGENGNYIITAQGCSATSKANIIFTGTTVDSASTLTITCEVTVIGSSEKVLDASGNTLYIDDQGKKEMTVAEYNSGSTYYYETEPKYYGWQTINKIRYYYDKNGKRVTGEQVIEGSKYKFGQDGALLTSGTGIDVSKWQGNVDWAQVSSVASFAIIRCGFRGQQSRGLYEDPYFRQNMKNAQANGLKVGVYFYSTAMNEVEAVEEASMALELVKGYSLSLPIYFDFEDNMQRDNLTTEQRTAIMNAFCKTIQNGGRTAGMYSYTYWLQHYVDMNTLPGNVSVWVAQFKAECSYTGRYDIWQYTSTGTVPGVNGKVDMNISYF